ncbi:hypothetical protein [Chitinophaga sp. 212800010-3]|uniref:hypothetical protein n=1 Tax=unclassified Chitinophaga TaxID=2619133 RepID=UPI002E133E2A
MVEIIVLRLQHLQQGGLGSYPFRYQDQYEDAERGLYYNRLLYYDLNTATGIYTSNCPMNCETSGLN